MSEADELQTTRDALRDELGAVERMLEEVRRAAGGEEAAKLASLLTEVEHEVATLTAEAEELDTTLASLERDAAAVRDDARRAREYLVDLRRKRE